MEHSSALQRLLQRIDQDSLPEGTPRPPPLLPVGPHRFSAYSFNALWPVVKWFVLLATHLLRPFLALTCFALALCGCNAHWTLPLGLGLLLLVLTRDEMMQLELGWYGLVRPGVYINEADPRNAMLLKSALVLQPDTYKDATPWLLTGDFRTLWPFLAFSHAKLQYHRRYLQVPENPGPCDQDWPDQSASASKSAARGRGADIRIAVDWALPPDGYQPHKPAILVLHGLNGGSQEEYVRDLVHTALAQGKAVCVMIARGLMDTFVDGEALFHGARTSDVAATVSHMRRVLEPETPIGAVGFSMGAIIIANHVARAGADCLLDAAVAVSGNVDPRLNALWDHSHRKWQPILAHTLKENFAGRNPHLLTATKINLPLIEKCESVRDIDFRMVAPYHNFDDAFHYYREMGAGCNGKLHNVATPLLNLSAIDDPITHADSFAPYLHVAQSNPNVIFAFTAKGGHVGWPTGWIPSRHKWSFMSTRSLQFIDVVIDADRVLRQGAGSATGRDQSSAPRRARLSSQRRRLGPGDVYHLYAYTFIASSKLGRTAAQMPKHHILVYWRCHRGDTPLHASSLFIIPGGTSLKSSFIRFNASSTDSSSSKKGGPICSMIWSIISTDDTRADTSD
eukprot:g73443.t1